MLPGVLSANLCSLLGGVERYAVSVTWELHPETFKVCRTSVADPDPGWVKVRIRMNNPGSYFQDLRNHFLGVNILKFFDADPGSGIDKIRIRDL
jgi:hypothetical protein